MDEQQYEERFKELLQDFAVHVGGDPLTCSDEGVCTLRVADEFLLNLLVNPSNGQLIFWMLLGEAPIAEDADTLAELLRANLFWDRTQGATISMLPNKDVVVLVRQCPVESITPEQMDEMICSLTEVALDLLPLLGRRIEMSDQLVSEDLLDHAMRV